jgi:hypothetical protein
MRIDTASPPAQQISNRAAQQTKEVPGERENDGDSDDKTQSVAKSASFQQINPQGVGTKVNIFA